MSSLSPCSRILCVFLPVAPYKVTENFPDKDVKMVVGCASGNRSKNACAWLVEAGYTNVVENAEGFTGWKAKGLPYKVAGSNAIF